MNIIEAIKSGLPFRRSKDMLKQWYEPQVLDAGRLNRMQGIFPYDDIIADDWVIKEPEVTITRAKLRDAFGRLSGPRDMKTNLMGTTMTFTYTPEAYINDLAKELGL